MKAFLISLALAFSAFSQDTHEPTDLTTLRNAWAAQKAAAAKSVDERYAISLAAMKDKFLKAGNLEAAVSVDNEIKGLTADANNAKIVTDLIGKWNITVTNVRYKGVWSFSKDGTVLQATGLQGRWTIEDKQVRIDWNPGQWETLTLPLSKTVKGDSWHGGKNSVNATKVR